MKKIGLLGFTALVIICFSGCKKNTDKPAKGECKIDYVVTKDLYDEDMILDFKYTSWGAPLSITQDESSTGSPDYFFQYDSKKRLIGFIAGFAQEGDTSFHYYHRYAYENNKIVRDTVWAENSLSGTATSDPAEIGYYTYDNHDRIIKYESHRLDDGEVSVVNYNYPNENPYVHNVSIMGTHKILMFVNRDYVKYNTATEYNEFGYPTKFALPGYRFHMHYIHTAVYNCDSGKNPHP